MSGSTPSGFLEGERLVLRAVVPSDVTDAYVAWMNDAEITRYLEIRFVPHSRESILEYVERARHDATNVFLAIVQRESGRHIGNIRLGAIDWVHRTAEVALVIGEKSLWGRGYATESIALVVDYAFRVLNLRKLSAGFYAPNEGSIRAFLKAGFVEEARRPKHFFSHGGWVDDVWLGVLNPNG